MKIPVKRKALGNVLIAVSIISTLYIFLPVWLQEFAYRIDAISQQSSEPKSNEFGIVIDKLGINEVVTANVDPFNKKEYMPVLQQGIAHASNTALPDQEGNVYLFSHSSDNPFSITRYNTSFYLLDKLKPGDEIKIYYQQHEHLYRVRETSVVKPHQVEALSQETQNQLTLQTCTPAGTATNRLLVFADPV